MKADMMKTSLIYTQNKNGEQKVKNKKKIKQICLVETLPVKSSWSQS